MNFVERLEEEYNNIRGYVTLMEVQKIADSAHDSDMDVPHLEEALILLEADSEISKAEKKAIAEDVNGTGVKLFLDKDGKKSFAVINKKKVMYFVETDQKNNMIELSASQWVAFEKALLDTGVTRVKGRSEVPAWLRFMETTAKGLMGPAKIFVSFAMRLVAMSVGIAYSSAIIKGIAAAVRGKTGEPIGKVAMEIIAGRREESNEIVDRGGWTVSIGGKVLENNNNESE